MDIHGGNIYKYNKEVLDYSSNINPLGVPKSLEKAIIENMSILERYPDINYKLLRESIGEYNNISKDNIIVGNGATEVLFLYMKAVKPKKALIVSPTFVEYERALRGIGCEIKYFPLTEVNKKDKNYYILDIEKLKENLDDIDMVVLCNPNNPTGHFISKDDLKDLNETLKEKNIKLFIDECFIEFINSWEEKTLASFKDKNIFILRALTKYFALPGLRLGYGVCFDEEMISKIQNTREPWSINAFADLAGQVILKDEEYIKKTNSWIEEERKYMIDSLKNIKGLKVYETTTNFILIKLKNTKSEIFLEKILEEDILVRNANNFNCIKGEFIRIAIKDREKNNKFLKSLKKLGFLLELSEKI